MVKNNQILIGGAVLFRESRGKKYWLLVKNSPEGDWEIPKNTVRKGESSVRAAIRLIGEQGGISARVLEEVGRTTGSTVIDDRTVPQKNYYYLMVQTAAAPEILGFADSCWKDYTKAIKMLSLKREKEMLKSAVKVLKEWEKTHKKEN